MVDRRADAAAVNAMAIRSQHSTIKAISHLIARSLSVCAPTRSATQRIGTASLSIWCSLAFSVEGDEVRASRLRSSTSPRGISAGLPPFCRHGGLRLAPPISLLIGEAPVEIGDGVLLDADFGVKGGGWVSSAAVVLPRSDS